MAEAATEVEWIEPDDDERAVFEAIVAYGKPRWRTLRQGTLTRYLADQIEVALREYLYEGGPPPAVTGR
jgi:hypothetical protein